MKIILLITIIWALIRTVSLSVITCKTGNWFVNFSNFAFMAMCFISLLFIIKGIN